MKKCTVSSVVQSHANKCNQRWHCIKKWFMCWLIKRLTRRAAWVWLISFNVSWVARDPSSSNRQDSHLENVARAWSRHRWCIATSLQKRDDTTFFFFSSTVEHPNKGLCVCDQYTVWADVWPVYQSRLRPLHLDWCGLSYSLEGGSRTTIRPLLAGRFLCTGPLASFQGTWHSVEHAHVMMWQAQTGPALRSKQKMMHRPPALHFPHKGNAKTYSLFFILDPH